MSSVDNSYKLCKALIVSKVTRLEAEKLNHPDINENHLKELLVHRGSDFDNILKLHKKQEDCEERIVKALIEHGVEVKSVKRRDCTSKDVEWADTVIPVGGDGTFLMAANKVRDQSKVIIGFNSDPENSVGYLCLPKWCSSDVFNTLKLIKEGKFSWMFRTRIRTTLYGADVNVRPTHLHRKGFCSNGKYETQVDGRVLPDLALNEVFIAEQLSARVSYLDIAVDDKISRLTKSSGLCVCTGSGSTSWSYTMNQISADMVQKLLSLTDVKCFDSDSLVKQYNQSLIFPPDEKRMSYTIRDLIPTSSWPELPHLLPKGYSKKIYVKSRCQDAGLVIDGGLSYSFNDGTNALIQTHPGDALRTITIQDKPKP